jgi:hypothetical protein
MSQQNIYHIQLLNDIHNHFPDILYNPNRFHNVQDLLQYIIDVANTSPYTRGLTNYNNRQFTTRPPPRVRTGPSYPPMGPVTPPPPPPSEPVLGGGAAGGGGAAAAAAFEDIPINTTFRYRVPLGVNNTSPLLNTLLSGMFGDILGTTVIGGNGMQSFLDTRVPVYPSNQEINASTTIHTATRRQDDICAICQDDIEINQEVRRLNHCGHYFHRNCIDTWFQGNVHCPTCRHDIREVNDNDRRSQENQNQNQNQNPNAPPPVPDSYRRMNIRRSNGGP